MKKTKKAAMIIVCVLLLLLIAGCAASIFIYEQNFGCRYDTYEPMMMHLEDFEGLERTEYKFPSDKGQMLTGYLYTHGLDRKGIIIIAHGFGGGGHNSYMNVADRFSQAGYDVFAYDATGCDESEGSGVGGLPQGVIDLDHAISFVENTFPDEPIGLFGHSWGGYCVSSVLTYHPEVKAVIECSGFCRSSDMFEFEGKRQAGDAIYAMLPFVKMYEQIKYGKYADNTALDGFAASNAKVMAVHSADDTVVPIEQGFDIYREKYENDPRFTFVRFEDHGHNNIFEDGAFFEEFNKGYDAWRDALDYDISAKENYERYQKDRADYFHNNLDMYRYTHSLDEELFDTFVKFYDDNMDA